MYQNVGGLSKGDVVIKGLNRWIDAAGEGGRLFVAVVLVLTIWMAMEMILFALRVPDSPATEAALIVGTIMIGVIMRFSFMRYIHLFGPRGHDHGA